MNRRTRTSIASLRLTLSVLLILGAIAVLGSISACSSGGDEEAAAAARQARLTELREQKATLDQARQDLKAMEDQLERAKSGELEEGEEVDQDALQAEIDKKNAEITNEAEKLNGDLVSFINDDPPLEGEPISPETKAAFDLKADEDIILAKEYITQGGEYGRAIQIYDDILSFAPDNQAAMDAKAEAETLRYMDEERFSQVKKGMNRKQVQEVLGTVNQRNVRDYPEKGLQAWYFPKDEEGNAAAVFFRKKGDGFEVYRTDFDAVKKQDEEGAEG